MFWWNDAPGSYVMLGVRTRLSVGKFAWKPLNHWRFVKILTRNYTDTEEPVKCWKSSASASGSRIFWILQHREMGHFHNLILIHISGKKGEVIRSPESVILSPWSNPDLSCLDICFTPVHLFMQRQMLLFISEIFVILIILFVYIRKRKRLCVIYFADDSEFDAQVPASFSPRAHAWRHQDGVVRRSTDVQFPGDTIRSGHRLPERQGLFSSAYYLFFIYYLFI